MEIPEREVVDEEIGESILYDDDFSLDRSALMDVIANEEVANVHPQVNFTRHLGVVEQQCLQQAAFMKYLRGIVVPHFQEVQGSNDELEKEMKAYKTQYEAAKATKDKVEKSNTSLKAELKKVREDLALGTVEMEAMKKETHDLRVEKERAEKAGGLSVGMDKQVVAALIKKNLARHQAKWDEEKEKLVAIGNNLVKESFENSFAQLSLRNPALVRDEVSYEFEVVRGQIFKVDTAARKLIDVDSSQEVANWDDEGSYREGEEQ
ncbi:DUF5068 domain-containing protein [Sesbania bispinosa]|nr:DUF5068 domain-containing protein [Sesbania bispinosa]